MFRQISHLTFQGYSCADLYGKGLKESGIYYLQIDGTKYWFLKTYCDMEAAAGGWTVRSMGRATLIINSYAEMQFKNEKRLCELASKAIGAVGQDSQEAGSRFNFIFCYI